MKTEIPAKTVWTCDRCDKESEKPLGWTLVRLEKPDEFRGFGDSSLPENFHLCESCMNPLWAALLK